MQKHGILIAGAEQTGKTYYAEQLCNGYARSTGRLSVIYNVGKPSDFSGAEICEPLSISQISMHLRGKKSTYDPRYVETLDFFKDAKTGKIYHFRDFVGFYKNKVVKIYKHENEEHLIRSFYKYIYGALIVFDDFRASTRNGAKSPIINLTCRKHHTGSAFTNNPGCDICFIYHNPDRFSPELYDYITRIVLFRLTKLPKSELIDNDELFEEMCNCANDLVTWPRFSRCELILRESADGKIVRINNISKQ